MKLKFFPILVLVATVLTCKSELPPDKLVQKLTAVIREACPDAMIQVTNNLFTAKYGTMLFTLHGHKMTGEMLPQTRQEEGPNFKGFVLTVRTESGRYEGQSWIPQELHGPYFKTFIDGPPTDDGKDHYWITFSYGSRLDPKLKQAILNALPKARLKQGIENIK